MSFLPNYDQAVLNNASHLVVPQLAEMSEVFNPYIHVDTVFVQGFEHALSPVNVASSVVTLILVARMAYSSKLYCRKLAVCL